MAIKKRGRRILTTTLIVFASIVAFVAVLGKGSFSFASYHADNKDYSDVITQGIGNTNPRVVDIAMLGAHDAFSTKVSTSSAVDPSEGADSMVRNSTIKIFADGLIVRLSRAQLGTAAIMLENGVRYFDIRLSDLNGEWYTKHALLSDKLSVYLTDVIDFLNHHPGELVVMDFHYVYFDTMTFEDLFTYLGNFKVDGFSLLDYMNFDPVATPLGELRYNQATLGGTRAGVVILAKLPASNPTYRYHYERGEGEGDGNFISIRSMWHNSSDTKTMLKGIRDEVTFLQTDTTYNDMFRVSQAQKTGVISGSDMADTLIGWSLIDLASSFNVTLVEQDDFSSWFEVMPILMVDFAISTRGQFNAKANDAMITFNQSLL
ncbi:MAG: hypothetical protein NTV44_04105 [Firmicutes bacterium]|nr:hypothetical protein [Bacillota bacterium]